MAALVVTGRCGDGLFSIIINETEYAIQLLTVLLLTSLVTDYIQVTDFPMWRNFGTGIEIAGLIVGGPGQFKACGCNRLASVRISRQF